MTKLVPALATATAMAAATRRGRRLRGLAVTLLVVALLAGGAKFLVAAGSNAAGRQGLTRLDYAGAQSWFEKTLLLNWFDPWLAHYNTGVAMYYQQNWSGAQGQFETALGLAPDNKKCQVALNLSWTLEGKGDSLASVGDLSNAALSWAQAKDVVTRANCNNQQQPKNDTPSPTDRDQGTPAQQQKDTQNRTQGKIDKAGQQQAPNQPDNQSQNTSQQLAQLRQASQQAQRAQQKALDNQNSAAQGSGKTW